MDGSNFASFQKEYDKEDENDCYTDEEGDHDTPYLLSNLEVYEVLRPRVQHRHRATARTSSSNANDETASAPAGGVTAKTPPAMATTNGAVLSTTTTTMERTMKKRQKLLRHRNWIEDAVVQYIQQTAAMEFHSTSHTLPLQSILRRRKRRSVSNTPVALSTEAPPKISSLPETTVTTANASLLNDETKSRLTTGFHLTEAEVIQLLNHSPQEMVDLHLYIDQIHDRFTISEQEELLRIVDHYRTPIQVLPTLTNGGATRHSLEPPASDPCTTNTNDGRAGNGVDTSTGSVRYSNSRSLHPTTTAPPPKSEDYEYPDGRSLHAVTTITASSNNNTVVTPSVFANHVKLEMIDRDDRKPAAI